MTDFAINRRAIECIAGGAASPLKAPHHFVKGVYPTHLIRGRGCWVFDPHGNKYMDFTSGGGTNILGYGQAQITAALADHLNSGFSFPLPTPHEIETAEKIKELFPFVDCMRFFKTEREASLYADNLSSDLDIVDETATGFRCPKFSFVGMNGTIPDIIILSGPIANGLPLAVVGAKYGVLSGSERQSYFNGEILGLIAAKTTMTLLQTRYDLNYLWRRGEEFVGEFNSIWPDKILLQGIPTFASFAGDSLVRTLFWQEACRAGMLFGPTYYMNFPLADECKNAMGSIKAILMRIKNGEVKLLGEMPE